MISTLIFHLKNKSRQLLIFLGCILFIFSFTAQSVAAISIYQQLQWPFYDSTSEACYPVGTETGDGPLFGLTMPAGVNPAALAASIDKYIENTRPDSPLKDTGNSFVAAGQHFNVNPAMLVGIAQKESSLGTADVPIVKQSFNSFGMFGNFPNQEKQYPITIDSDGSKVPNFGSFKDSPFAAADYISAGWLKPNGPFYSTETILEMMKNFTPKTPEASTKKTLDVMHKILDGLSTSGSPAASIPVVSSAKHAFPVMKDYTYSDDWAKPRQDTGAGGDWKSAHPGIDIFAPTGTPVVAVTDGVVKVTGFTDLGGNRLWLQSVDGNSYYYAHLSAYASGLGPVNGPNLNPEKVVKAGEEIGYVGATAKDGAGDPHLHFSASHIAFPASRITFSEARGSTAFIDSAGNSFEPFTPPTDPPPAKDGPGLFYPYEYLKGWEAGRNTASGSSSTTSTTGVTGSQASLDLDAIAKKYGLHSAMVKQLGGPILGTYNADQKPNAPASVLKLIIADLFLQKNPDPDEASKTTMRQMLQYSDNNAANSLMDKAGGLPLTDAARQRGYSNTNIDVHYSSSATTVINGTTVGDLTKAMDTIFSTQSNGYGAAQDYLRNSSEKFGINSYANKWGGVAGDSTGKPVTGNSAVWEAGSTRYIITIYINERYDSPSSPSVTKIRNATNEIASKLSGTPVIVPGATGANGCQSNFRGGANGYEMSQMVSYEQADPKWGSKPYGTGKSSIAESGCGPASLAMIGATLLNDTSITPETLANKYGDKYHGPQGSDWGIFPAFAADTGLKYKDLGKDFGVAAQIVRNGGLVVISVDPGHFTSSGHIMVIRAVTADGTGFYLADPNGDGYNNDSETRAFSPEFFASTGSLKNLWGYYR